MSLRKLVTSEQILTLPENLTHFNFCLLLWHLSVKHFCFLGSHFNGGIFYSYFSIVIKVVAGIIKWYIDAVFYHSLCHSNRKEIYISWKCLCCLIIIVLDTFIEWTIHWMKKASVFGLERWYEAFDQYTYNRHSTSVHVKKRPICQSIPSKCKQSLI